MKFQTFLEKKGEKAHREAIAMGLQYKGFGYWADPQTGEAKYKTVNDQLIPVEPDVESDLYKGKEKEDPAASSGAAPEKMAVPGGATAGAMKQVVGQGISQGTPEGMLAAPQKQTGWQAGPDGDTCVDGEKPEVAKDVFVGKTNFARWTAGPDGSNAMELGEMRQIIERLGDAKWSGKSQGKPLIPSTEDLPDDRPRPGAGTIMRQAMGAQKIGSDNRFKKTLGQAKDAVQGMKDKGHDTVLGNQIAQMLRIKNQSKRYPDQETFDLEAGKQNDMWRKAMKLPAVLKDADATKAMNEAARGLVKDPNFDLDKFDESDDYLDAGAFGEVFDAGDAVIKKGYIGPKELAALAKMKESKYFPDLINARFTAPFKHMSSMYNNPNNNDDERRATGQDAYWNPEEKSEFEDRFVGAEGKYAMSKAKGEPLYNIWDVLGDEQKSKVLNQFWEARAELHRSGFSHNDMHGGNIFVDEDGNLQIIDLGLADDDPLSALMEAVGGVNTEEGGDYQMAGQVTPNEDSELETEYQKAYQMKDNLENLRQRLMDEIPTDDEDYDDVDEDGMSLRRMQVMSTLDDLMKGDIRMTREQLEHLREDIPFLRERGNVMSLIDTLYEGVGMTDQQTRMSQAFDRIRQEPNVKEFEKIRNVLGRLGKKKPEMKGIDFDD